MEFIVIIAILIIIDLILRYIFDIDAKKIKEIADDEELNKIVEKYPQNVEICKEYLQKIKNQSVKIQEDKESGTTLYLVYSNKILIADLKNNYTRLQTIAHECLHSIQSKKMLWFNFIFSNIYILYFIIACVLGIFKLIPDKMIFLSILFIFGMTYYAIRVYLENDAMIKARFLAKEYMQEKKISSELEIEKVVNKYDELNKYGIKYTNFQLINNVIGKLIILSLIFILR